MKFYRYKEIRTTFEVKVNLEEFVLIKETPKGYWIKRDWDHENEHKRWVSSTAKKRFAYPSKEEAMIAFKARKNRQIEILQSTIQTAKSALYFVENREI